MKHLLEDLDVGTLANSLTFQLPGWRVKPPEPDSQNRHRAVLEKADERGTDKPSLIVVWSHYSQTLSVYGQFPSGYDERGHTIDMDPTKAINRIASDIRHRLLANYLPAFAKALETRKEDDRRKALAVTSAKALGKILGDNPLRRNDPDRHRYQRSLELALYGGTPDERGQWKITSYHPEHVEITRLLVPLPIAIHLALDLQAHWKKQQAKKKGETSG
jgi:hypothetical protein